jgi:hypothetical protein
MADPTENPEVKAALVETDQLALGVATYAVTTAEQYEGSGELLKRIKAGQKRLEDLRTGITKPLNDALKRVNDLFRAPAEKLVAAERTVKRALVAYSDEQDRIRREEERKAQAAADAERRRLQAIADEAARKAREETERLRREAEAAAAAGRAEEAAKLAARATRVEEVGAAKSEAFAERAATVVAEPVAAAAPPPKVTGVNTRTIWKFEIVDPSKVNAAFLMIDEKKIGATVRAMKGSARDVVGPGVRIWEERDIAATSAA